MVLQVAAMMPCKLSFGVEKAETPAKYSEVDAFICVIALCIFGNYLHCVTEKNVPTVFLLRVCHRDVKFVFSNLNFVSKFEFCSNFV